MQTDNTDAHPRNPAGVIAISIFALGALASFAGCNTLKGVGYDISSAAQDVEDTLFPEHGVQYTAQKRY